MSKRTTCKQIYLNGEYVPVTNEVYQAWYRPIWRTHDFARRHGQCSLSRWQLCGGDCAVCRYRMAGDHSSIDELRENFELEPADPHADPEEIVLDAILLEQLVKELDELDPYGLQIAQMIAGDIDDRTAAKRLGMAKSTYSDRKLKLLAMIRKRFRDD